MAPTKEEIIEDLLSQLNTDRVIGFPIATLTVTYFFYGMYMILMTLCVVLLMRNRFDSRRYYLISTLSLFAICTTMVVVVTVFRTQEAALEYDFATTRDERPFIHYALDVEP
ncbi:hypothetical protein AAF712_016337, partial [Marasmius tenuissimus]